MRAEPDPTPMRIVDLSPLERPKLFLWDGHRLWLRQDGRRLLVKSGQSCMGDQDTILHLVDAKTGERLLSLEGDSFAVTVSPSGHHFFLNGTWDRDGVWSIETGEMVFPLPRGQSTVAFSFDGNLLALGSSRSKEQPHIGIWELSSGRELLRLPGNRGAFCINGDCFVCRDGDGAARVYEIGTGRELSFGPDELCSGLAPAPESELVGMWFGAWPPPPDRPYAVENMDEVWNVTDRETGAELCSIPRRSREVACSAGPYIAILDHTEGPRLYEVQPL